jgi:opacity protein-like surface antigen
MKKLYVLALSLLTVPALADNSRGFYLGLGGSRIEILQDGLNETSPIKAAEILAGYKYNNALGLEIRYGSGQTKAERDAKNTAAKGVLTHDVESYSSIYYRPELVNDEAKLYALLGYTQIDVSTVVGAAAPVSVSESGVSYGIGISFVMADQFNLSFEYKNICEELSNKPTVYSILVDYRF